MSTTSKIGLVLTGALIALTGVFVALYSQRAKAEILGGVNYLTSIATSSVIQVCNAASNNCTGTQVLATSTARVWAIISNNSPLGVMCNFNNGTPMSSSSLAGFQGFVITASTTFQITASALYTGQVNCVSQGGTSTVYVEAQQ